MFMLTVLFHSIMISFQIAAFESAIIFRYDNADESDYSVRFRQVPASTRFSGES